MKRIKNYTPVAFALLIIWALSPAAQAKNTLKCLIVDEAENPLAKQEIILTSAASGKEWKRKTNDKGEVEFKGLDDGGYTIGGQVQGYMAAGHDPIELSGNVTKPHQHTFYSIDSINALLQQANAELQARNFDAALEIGKQLVSYVPSLAPTHYVLSVAYAAKGMESEAIKHIRKASELDAEKFEQHIPNIRLMSMSSEAEAALSGKDFDGAIRRFEEILKVSPTHANAYYGMALAYGHKDQFDEALKSIDKAIELQPADAEFRQMKERLQDLYMKSMDEKLEIPK